MRGAVAAIGCALLVAAGTACGGDESFPRVVTLGEGDVAPAILNDSLTVGENRLLFEFTGPDGEFIFDARVRFKLFDLTSGDAELAGEHDARFVPVQLGFVDEEARGGRVETGAGGVYVARVSFDRAGAWGMKIDVDAPDQSHDDVPFRFTVLERSAEPMVGDEAPPSRQAVLAPGVDIADIDSSSPSRPQMHDITVADAIAAARPSVVAFGTPAFCESRTCAPLLDTVMDPLAARYAGRATFIHIEPYELAPLRETGEEVPVLAMREWNLQSEPWIFVIDGRGRVAGKFQGIVALDEVEDVVRATLDAR